MEENQQAEAAFAAWFKNKTGRKPLRVIREDADFREAFLAGFLSCLNPEVFACSLSTLSTKGTAQKTDLALQAALGGRSHSGYGWGERDMGWDCKTEKEFNGAVERLKKFREHQRAINDPSPIEIAHTVSGEPGWRELQEDNTWKDKQYAH